MQDSTRTKIRGSRGGRCRRLPDQDQWITGRTERMAVQHGQECTLDQDQVQGINWEHSADRTERRSKGEGWRESKNAKLHLRARMLRAEHPCRCVYGQTHRIKLHIVRPRLVRYACIK